MAEPTPGELMRAQGHLVVFLASLLQRQGVIQAGEFAGLLQVFADATAETDPAEGEVLAFWAAAVRTIAPH